MIEITTLPKKQVFVCVNERTDGRNCCKNVGAEEIVQELKQFVKDNHKTDVWVTRSRCLGFCNAVGPTIIIYPEQKMFTQVTKEDVEEIKKRM